MRRLALLAAILALGLANSAHAQPRRAWTETKCTRYADAWREALARFGREGLGETFLARHDIFLASGCQTRPAVCPHSPQERAIADAVTVAAMNGGAASTFLPFLCRQGDGGG